MFLRRRIFHSSRLTCIRCPCPVVKQKMFGMMTLKYFSLDRHNRTGGESAPNANGRFEDKGLIECLMVKCAKVLVYCEGEKESYGNRCRGSDGAKFGKATFSRSH